MPIIGVLYFFFFNDTATTEIYTLSLHDALPISRAGPPTALHRARRAGPVHRRAVAGRAAAPAGPRAPRRRPHRLPPREIGRHTSELQSRQYLVCRLLLEKKKQES